MLYGSRVSTDIHGKQMSDSWAKQSRLDVTHVLSHEPEGSSWAGKTGFITKELTAEKFPSPERRTLSSLCAALPSCTTSSAAHVVRVRSLESSPRWDTPLNKSTSSK